MISACCISTRFVRVTYNANVVCGSCLVNPCGGHHPYPSQIYIQLKKVLYMIFT